MRGKAFKTEPLPTHDADDYEDFNWNDFGHEEHDMHNGDDYDMPHMKNGSGDDYDMTHMKDGGDYYGMPHMNMKGADMLYINKEAGSEESSMPPVKTEREPFSSSSSSYDPRSSTSSDQKSPQQAKVRTTVTGLSAAISISGTTEKALIASPAAQKAILEGYATATQIPVGSLDISQIGNAVTGFRRRLQEAKPVAEEAEDQSAIDKAKDTAAAAGQGIATAATSSANAVSGAATTSANAVSGAATTSANAVSGAATSAASGISSLWNKATAESLRVHFHVTASSVAEEDRYEQQINGASASAVQRAIVASAQAAGIASEFPDVKVTAVSKAVEFGETPQEDSLLGRVAAAGGVDKAVVAGAAAGVFLLASMCAIYMCCIRKSNTPKSNGPVSASNVERHLDVGGPAKYTSPAMKL
jgi:hypothetical protein